jgi:hypothetical protein
MKKEFDNPIKVCASQEPCQPTDMHLSDIGISTALASLVPVQERHSAYAVTGLHIWLAGPVRCSWGASEGVSCLRPCAAFLASCKFAFPSRPSFGIESFIMSGGWLLFDNGQCLYSDELARGG